MASQTPEWDQCSTVNSQPGCLSPRTILAFFSLFEATLFEQRMTPEKFRGRPGLLSSSRELIVSFFLRQLFVDLCLKNSVMLQFSRSSYCSLRCGPIYEL